METSGSADYLTCYDGNGNITGLIKADDGQRLATYAYGPFGEPLRATGAMAKANPFRWSTKYCDEETGLCYYGYRYYSPVMGRWVSRDPISNMAYLTLDISTATYQLILEQLKSAGEPLYGFVQNSSISTYDYLGLAFFQKRPLSGTGSGKKQGGTWIPILSKNPVSDALNIEVAHEQLFFEDGLKPHDIGFADGHMVIDDQASGYRRIPGNYIDCFMRQAVAKVGNPQPYCFIGKNCQDWATKVRKEYREIVGSK